MSELGDRMGMLKDAFAAKYPERKIGRTWKDRAAHERQDLLAGIYTLVSMGEDDFTNANGYLAMDGLQGIKIFGQIELAEGSDGEAVEEAEFALIDEIKAFVRAPGASVCLLTLNRWAQSGQLEAPYGWVIADLGYKP